MFHLLNPDTTDKIFNAYESDLTEKTVFDGEIVRWKSKVGARWPRRQTNHSEADALLHQ